MKKVVISFVSVICAVMLCLAFAGCGEKAESVAGNTYVYESCTVSDPAKQGAAEFQFSRLSYKFNADGTYEQMADGVVVAKGKWTQNNDKGTITQDPPEGVSMEEWLAVVKPADFKVVGDKIELTASYTDYNTSITSTVVFKKQPKTE